jgi:mRNA interferase MazF
MGRFVKGDVVVLPFPFSDLSQLKKRPALVLANLGSDDIIVCQITSQPWSDTDAISLMRVDFVHGGLNKNSFIRPNRLFTADSAIVHYSAGQVSSRKVKEAIDRIILILS